MGKLLILSWGVYPSKGGSTFLVNNIAERYGADELVIIGQKPTTMPDEKWEHISKVKMYYLDPYPFGLKLFSRILPWLKVGMLSREVKTIIEQENVDRILAIFPNEYYCYIAMKVSSALGIPFSIWFHNTYLENRKGVWKLMAEWLQPQLFAKAKNTFVMSEGMSAELAKIYPSQNFEPLVHGLNIEEEKLDYSQRDISGKVKFLYTGTLNQACFDASLRMFKVLMANPDYELYISTGDEAAFISRGITGDGVIFTPYLPMDEFLEDLKNYDIMLLPHGFTGAFSELEYRTIFPTRTIPLLFSGRPILAHSPSNSFLNKFLEENDCSVLVDEADEQLIENGIQKIISDKVLVERITSNALKAGQQFKVENIISKIEELV